MRVAAYVRISRDQEGRAEGVADQERACRAYITDRWPDATVTVYRDNDLSAAKAETHRPGYNALVAAITAGTIDELVVVEQSRLTRQTTQWFALEESLSGAGITQVHTTREGVIDVEGELAGIKSVLNRAEVRKLTQRTRDKHEALAADGRPHGGSTFGYRPGRNERGEATLEIVDTEAAVIGEAAERILAGWSLVAIARDWNARDIPRRRGSKAWSEKTVRQVVTKPTVAGIRVHKGTSRRATWAPILDESTWQAVRATLDARWAAQARGRTRRRFLLTGGVATCGRCGAGLIAQQRKYSGRTVPYYLCPSPTRGGCSRLGVVAEPFEDYVADMLLDELDKPAMRVALAHDEHDTQRAALMRDLTAVDVRRADLARRWAAGSLSGDEWDAAKAGLVAEQTRLSAELSALPPPAVDIDPQVIRDGWDLMTLDERRQVIDLFIDKAVVAPAKPGTRRFDPDRIEIEWRAL